VWAAERRFSPQILGRKNVPIDTFFPCESLSEADTFIMKNQMPTLLVPASALRTHRYEKSKIECGTFGMFESVKARADFGTGKGLSEQRYNNNNRT
jgi:hypothetical protein